MRVTEEDFKLQCEKCGRMCKTALALVMYSRSHTDGVPYLSCHSCDEMFKRQQNLKQHLQRNHVKESVSDSRQDGPEAEQYNCDLCGKMFTEYRSLRVHTELHICEKPFCCTFCGRSFQRSHHLVRHRALHTRKFKYRCNICGQGFAYTSDIDRHMQKHSVSKNFKCDICEKTFVHRNSLQKHRNAAHLETHKGRAVKRSVCNVCGRSFFELSGLKRHMIIHTGEKEALCLICGSEFTRITSLTRHIRRRHNTLKIKTEFAVSHEVPTVSVPKIKEELGNV